MRWFALACWFFAGISSGAVQTLQLETTGYTDVPVGYSEFCEHFNGECVRQGNDAPMRWTEKRRDELVEANDFYNTTISPMTDERNYSRDEVWTLPKNTGDCEDYVLLKRKWLIERGWSTGSLLVTVVWARKEDNPREWEGHAVLTARTTKGAFILDNKRRQILEWWQTGYVFSKRQSFADPNRWVSLGDPRWATQPATASH